MANRFYSGWAAAEETNWAQCQAELNKDNSFVDPQFPCSESTTSSQYCGYSMPFGGIKEEDRAAASTASKNHIHSQAEKRRRDRINAHLATLRKLIPNSDKMDKAGLLGSVVEHVKDLKRKALEVSKLITVPTDIDEVTIDYYSDHEDGSSINGSKSEDRIFIKASVCCDDRPELFAELTQALRGLKLKTVRADMACLGGRIKSILVLCTNDSKDGVCLNNIKQSLNRVLSRIALSNSTSSNYRIRSKRQRRKISSSNQENERQTENPHSYGLKTGIPCMGSLYHRFGVAIGRNVIRNLNAKVAIVKDIVEIGLIEGMKFCKASLI